MPEPLVNGVEDVLRFFLSLLHRPDIWLINRVQESLRESISYYLIRCYEILLSASWNQKILHGNCSNTSLGLFTVG